jgi:NurA-like 5'-3' nuclease
MTTPVKSPTNLAEDIYKKADTFWNQAPSENKEYECTRAMPSPEVKRDYIAKIGKTVKIVQTLSNGNNDTCYIDTTLTNQFGKKFAVCYHKGNKGYFLAEISPEELEKFKNAICPAGNT